MFDYISENLDHPLMLNEPMSWFAYDVMGLISYDQDFGMVKSRQTRQELRDQSAALAMMAPMNDAIWLVRLGFAMFPFLKPIRSWLDAERFCCDRMEKRLKVSYTRQSLLLERQLIRCHSSDSFRVACDRYVSFFIKEYQDLEGSRSFGSRQNLLHGNAISTMVAGSDTTKAGLIAIWYFLCKHPEHAQKIYEEVKDINVSDIHTLATLPHLNGAVKETLRLAPPTMTGRARITGPAGIWVDQTYIPPGVKVSAIKYVSHRRNLNLQCGAY
jgi:hypothetical protein